MSVFISHSTKDDNVATFVGLALRSKDVPVYADHFNDAADSAIHITRFLMSRINGCTHLLAVITESTINSWWVPFEIGVARQGNRRITTFNRHGRKLPEYLEEWPILTSYAEFGTFAETYHSDAKHTILTPEEKQASAIPEYLTSPDIFHRQLKTQLGQVQ